MYDGLSAAGTDSERMTGRLQFNFGDAEPSYYSIATYLGKKDTVGIGVSYDTQSNVAGSSTPLTDYTYWNVDVFAEKPQGSGASVSFEASYHSLDLNGANAQAEGDGFYVQAGFLMSNKKWQPWFLYEDWSADAASGKGSYDLWRVWHELLHEGTQRQRQVRLRELQCRRQHRLLERGLDRQPGGRPLHHLLSNADRQMLRSGPRAAARGVLMVIRLRAAPGAVGAQAEEGGTGSPSSLAAFDDLYDRLVESPDGGSPSAGLATAAEELRFGLRTDLIRSDAEIEVLKLEAARFTGERQKQALDDLVRAAAARERQLWVALRQLERLAGEPPGPVEEAEPQSDRGEKNGGFGIAFEAQDLIEDPDP